MQIPQQSDRDVQEEEILLEAFDRDDDVQTSPDSSEKQPKRHLGLLSTTFLITNRMIGTAIFSVPSSIADSVGSAGAAISLWIVGFVLSLCGLMIWLELGCLLPRSGGEKVYLEAAYPRPKLLATTVFATYVTFLGFTGIGSIVVAENLLLAFHGIVEDWVKRCLAIAAMALIALMHIVAKTFTIKLMNVLASVKIFILLLIIFTGIKVLFDKNNPRVPYPAASYVHPFADSSPHIYDYTSALFKILATYQGWSNAAYVLDEVKDPKRTLKIAGLLGLGSVGVLYTLVNMAYFAAATPGELSHTGVTVVALLIGKVYGETMQWCTAVLAMLSSLGNIMTSSFAMSRVIQSYGKEGILPFPTFFASSTSSGSPMGAFLGVFFASIIMIVLIPFGDAYNFLLEVGQYSMTIIYFAVVLGLFILRKRMQNANRTFRVWTSVACVFLLTQAFLVLSPFLHSGNDKSALPFWLTPVIAVLALTGGGAYWYGWTVSLPRSKGFSWESRESILQDGTKRVTWTRKYK